MQGSYSRYILIAGLLLLLLGGVVYLFERSGLRLGNLPGDIRIEKGNTTCVFFLGTSILISIILTILLNLAAKWLSR